MMSHLLIYPTNIYWTPVVPGLRENTAQWGRGMSIWRRLWYHGEVRALGAQRMGTSSRKGMMSRWVLQLEWEDPGGQEELVGQSGSKKSDPLGCRTRAGDYSYPRCCSPNVEQTSVLQPALQGASDNLTISSSDGCFDRGGQSGSWNVVRSHGLTRTEAPMIRDMEHRRFTLNLSRPGMDTHHDGSQGESVSPFRSVPPVVQKLNELGLQFLHLWNGNNLSLQWILPRH